MHRMELIRAGRKINGADKVLIMIHGRGGNAEDILVLSKELSVEDYALLAPHATNKSWYPYSFLFPPAQNEPWLSSALDVINDLVIEVGALGIKKENIYFEY